MDEQQKHDFAARLQRIQARQEDLGAPPEQPEMVQNGDQLPPLPPVNPPSGGGSGFGPIRMALIFIVILAMGGLGALYVADLAQDPVTVADASATPAESAPLNVSPEPQPALLAFDVDRAEPKQAGQRTVTDRGYDHSPGSVATPDGALVQVADIATGFDLAGSNAAPAELVPFQPNETCTLRPPQAGDVLRNVRLGGANGETPVHAFSDEALSKAVLDHTQAALFKPKSYEVGTTAKGRLNRADVFVTDTSGPIYLVLQAMWGNTLWNVHRGPGVQIAHIAIIGNTSGIVAPEGVPFEALRITDFVTNFEFGANDTVRPCMIAPYRLPKPEWVASQKALKGNTLFENQMFSFNSGHRAFSAWYQETLGADPETGLTEAEGASHALVGPVPTSLLGYRSLAGRTVHVVNADNLIIGDEAVADTHRAALLVAAGGDAMAILPAARRVQP